MCNMCADGVMAGHFSSATLTAFKQVVASGKDVYMLIALPTAMGWTATCSKRLAAGLARAPL